MHWLSLISSIIVTSSRGFAQARTRPATRIDGDRPPRVSPPPELAGAGVRYMNDGRSGKVIFGMGAKSFEMYFEFGDGDVLATIVIPSRDEWQKQTGIPTELRESVLKFIGRSVVRDQTTSGRGRFEIHDKHISIYG